METGLNEELRATKEAADREKEHARRVEENSASLNKELGVTRETAALERERAELAKGKIIRMQQEYESALADGRRLTEELIELRPAVWSFLRLRQAREKNEGNQRLTFTPPEPYKYRSAVFLRHKEFNHRHFQNDAEYSFDRVFQETESNEVV